MISPYIVLFGIVVCLFLLSRVVPRLNGKLYFLSFVLMTLFLMLRYGQGSDYSMYEWFYMAAPKSLDFSSYYFSSAYHTEIGWKAVMCVLKIVGIPFEAFIAVFSAFMMACLNRCIRRFSPDPMLSLLIAFPTLYLTGYFSMLREGLVVAVFLGFMLQWILDGRTVRYVLLAAALASIHTVALVLLLALFVHKFVSTENGRSWLFLFAICCFLFGMATVVVAPLHSAMESVPGAGFYYQNNQLSIPSLCERAMWFAIIVPLGYKAAFSLNGGVDRQNKLVLQLLDLYVFGFSLYCLFAGAANAATRFSFPFEMLEVLLVPIVFGLVPRWKNAVAVLVVCLALVFVAKNLNSYLDQRGYYSFVTWWSYPYVSVFDDPSTLSWYRVPYIHTGKP